MSRYIDAEALLDTLFKRYCEDCDKRKGIKNGKWEIIYQVGEAPCKACNTDDTKCEIEEEPTADVRENVHGEWIDDYDPANFGEFRYKCSKCGARTVERADNFCYQCGADMRGEEDDQT